MRTLFLLATFLLLCGFAAAPDPTSSSDLLEVGYDAIVHGNWWVVAGVALSAVYLFARSYGPWKTLIGGIDERVVEPHPAARDWRGYVGIVVLATTVGFGHALFTGAPFNAALVLAVLKVLGTAMFTYVTGKKAVAPALKSLGKREVM